MRIWISSLIVVGLCAMGCSQQAPAPSTTQPTGANKNQVAATSGHDDDHKDDDHDHDHAKDDAKSAKKPHDHSGWWCGEHGVPEAQCSQCSSKVAADFQKKGDWCAEHDRAKSQCFICDPSLKDKFAAQYRAKEGKEPPPLEDEKAKDKDEHDEHEKKS